MASHCSDGNSDSSHTESCGECNAVELAPLALDKVQVFWGRSLEPLSIEVCLQVDDTPSEVACAHPVSGNKDAKDDTDPCVRLM